MTKEKACKNCGRIYEGNECPKCGSKDFAENFKGRVVIFNSEKSEIAQKLKIKDSGEYAIKVR